MAKLPQPQPISRMWSVGWMSAAAITASSLASCAACMLQDNSQGSQHTDICCPAGAYTYTKSWHARGTVIMGKPWAVLVLQQHGKAPPHTLRSPFCSSVCTPQL